MARGRKKKNKWKKRMRRANGTGSISLLSNPERRRKPWGVRAPDGIEIVTKNDKPHVKYKYKFLGSTETYEEGEKLLNKYNEMRANGLVGIAPSATFAEIYKQAFERYILTKRPVESTKASYLSAYKQCGALYDLPVSGMKTEHMQHVVDNMLQEGYSTSAIEGVKKVCNLVMELALRNDIVNKQYASFIELGKRTKRKKRRAMTDEEVSYILKHGNEKNIDIILIYIFTGLRLNELLTLKNEDIHLKERYLIAGSKTEAGRDRIIPISKKISKYIKKRMDPEQTYLIHTRTGNKYEKNYFRQTVYTPAITSLGMDYTPHECRHTCITLLSRADANLVSIQKIVGHKGQNVTEQVYIHKTLDDLIKAIDLI